MTKKSRKKDQKKHEKKKNEKKGHFWVKHGYKMGQKKLFFDRFFHKKTKKKFQFHDFRKKHDFSASGTMAQKIGSKMGVFFRLFQKKAKKKNFFFKKSYAQTLPLFDF